MINLATLLFIALIFCETAIRNKRDKAVKGSYQRYVLSTWRNIVGGMKLLLTFAGTVFFLATGADLFYTICLSGGFAATLLFEIIIYAFTDEDNWFRNRGKKIWNSIKNTIRTLQPKPITTVAGVTA